VRECSPGSNPGLSAIKTKAYETIFTDFASLFLRPKSPKSDIAPIFGALTTPGEFDFDRIRDQMPVVLFSYFHRTVSKPAADDEDIDAGQLMSEGEVFLIQAVSLRIMIF